MKINKPTINVNEDAVGDILYRGPSGELERLGIGDAYGVLSVNGAETTPQWTATNDLIETASDILTISNGENAVIGLGTTIQVKKASASQDGYLGKDDFVAFSSGGHNPVTLAQSSVTGGLSLNNQEVSFRAANTSLDGYLKHVDWNTFNAKEPAQTKGSISETTSSILVVSNGTNSTVGPNVTVQVKKASALQDGYLGKDDFVAFSSGGHNPVTLAQSAITGGLSLNDQEMSFRAADTNYDGYLKSADWDTFNSKEPAVTKGNLTSSTTSVISIGSGSGAVIGTGTSITINKSSASNDGYLGKDDWSTFNSKEPAQTKGSISEISSSILTVSNGSSSTVGPNVTIEVKKASISQDGYLGKNDWNTFNSKQDTITKYDLSETASGVLTITGGTDGVITNDITIQVKKASSLQDGYLGKDDFATFSSSTHNPVTLAQSSLTGGLSLNNQEISFRAADTNVDGYLKSSDWDTFNGKQDSITKYDLSETTSGILIIVGGTDSVLTNDVTIQVKKASISQDGYLGKNDWNTFNNKQDAITKYDLSETVSGILTIVGGTDSILTNDVTIQVKKASASQDGYLGKDDFSTFNSGIHNPVTLASSAVTGGLSLNNQEISFRAADTNYDGYLKSADWDTFNNKITDPMTTIGDLIYRNGSNVIDRLPLGADGYVLSSNGTNVLWQFDPAPKVLHGVVARSTAAGLNCLPTHITTTTFTLGATANPITYYYQGKEIVVSSDKTATLDDGAGGSTAGLYYVYFNAGSGTLLATKNFPGVLSTSNVLVASIVWNGSNYGLVGDERHGYNRDHAWHNWAHNTVGVRYRSGFDFVPTGTGAGATFTMSGGELWDEDIQFSSLISSSWPTAHALRTFYQTGATTFAFDSVTSTIPYRSGTNSRPTYVNSTGYVLTTMTSAVNRYINFFIYGTTDLHTPVYCFAETVSNTVASNNGYNNVSLARSVSFPNLNGLGLSPELRPLYRLVVRADGQVQSLIPADDYRTVSSLPQAAGTTATTASAVSFNPVGNVSSTNVQLAIEELDSEKEPVQTKGSISEITSSVLTVTNGTNSTVGPNVTIQVKKASASQDGYLGKDNWETFNAKEPAQTKGSISETASSVLTVTNGVNSTVGPNVTIQVKKASISQDGYLGKNDWNTFNNKQDTITKYDLSETSSGILTITGGTDSVLTNDVTIQVKKASASQDGYLGKDNWATFNAKEPAQTKGTISSGTTSAITVINGSSATVGPNTSITINKASASSDGYLGKDNWTTFNSKESSLTFSTGLNRSTNTITSNISIGVSGGQSIYGGTASGDDLTIYSTSNATKGNIFFGNSTYDEVNNRLGIGVVAPQATLDVQATSAWIRAYGSTNPYISAQDSTNDCVVKMQALDTFAYLGTQSDHQVRFIVNNLAKAYLTTSGYLGIGIDTPLYKLHTSDDATGNGTCIFDSHSSTDYGTWVYLRRSGGTQSSPLAVPNGHRLGNICFSGYYDASSWSYSSVIQSIAIGLWSATNRGSCLQFFTTATDTTTTTERMRIADSGNVGVKATSPTSLFQVGSKATNEVNDIVARTKVYGNATQSQTEEVMLRMIRNENGGQYYPGSVDFKLSAYQAGGSPFSPASKLVIALKAAANFNEGADVNVMTLFSSGKVGIMNTTPSALLTLGTAGTTAGTLSLAGATSGTVTVDVAAAAGTWTLTLPTAAPTTSGQVLSATTDGDASWSTITTPPLSIPGSDHSYSGTAITATAGETVAIGDVCYFKSDGKFWKADADAATTSDGMLAIATAAISADASGVFLLQGLYRDDTWNWTVGGKLYIDVTPGNPTATAPSATGDIVRIIGYAFSADVVYFNPDNTFVELT